MLKGIKNDVKMVKYICTAVNIELAKVGYRKAVLSGDEKRIKNLTKDINKYKKIMNTIEEEIEFV